MVLGIADGLNPGDRPAGGPHRQLRQITIANPFRALRTKSGCNRERLTATLGGSERSRLVCDDLGMRIGNLEGRAEIQATFPAEL